MQPVITSFLNSANRAELFAAGEFVWVGWLRNASARSSRKAIEVKLAFFQPQESSCGQ